MNHSVISGENVFQELSRFVTTLKPTSVFILTDENVNKYCLPGLLELCQILKSAVVIEIPSGEDEKNISIFARIISMLQESLADRNSLLINLGGGVICDLGGFVASVYKRGIRFINIPTTLLAMVDASIGGKNGINFLDAKNMIGTFTRPGGVFIFTDFIRTLSAREKKSGMAEILKHIILSDSVKWKEIRNNPKSLEDDKLVELIDFSVKFKTQITEEDFLEEGRRKILNFGHTIAHSLEGFSLSEKNSLLHGEAVAAGMISELFLSNKLAGFPEQEMHDAVQFIRKVFEDVLINPAPEVIIPFLYSDKKNTNDKIAFSLLKGIGRPAGIFYPRIDDIVESLIFMNNQFSRDLVQ
jgi:3-dehydroquinate synthase